MLNKDLLMAVDEDEGLEPALSIYFAPGNQAGVVVSVMLSAGTRVDIENAPGKELRLKCSEIDVTASIDVKYDSSLKRITTKNLIDIQLSYTRAADLADRSFWIGDVTQSASLVIE